MRIGELARLTGAKVETIRFYEASGLLPPPHRTPRNYRSYDPGHLDRLTFIRRARSLGLSLDDVRELMTLTDDPARPCEAVDAIVGSHLREVERKLADLARLRGELRRMLTSCKSGRVSDCRIIEALLPGKDAPVPRPGKPATTPPS